MTPARLRHTCVTLLLDAGVRPHIVQAIAGHSGIQVTMSIYAQAVQEQRKALSPTAVKVALTGWDRWVVTLVSWSARVGAAGFEPATPRL